MKWWHWILLAVVALALGAVVSRAGGSRIGSGIAGALAAFVGLLFHGSRKRPGDLAGAVDRAERARREAQLELDAAVDRGLAHRKAVDEKANREVENAGDLGDLVARSNTEANHDD